jgi:polyhydroxybutyrate depolymerase
MGGRRSGGTAWCLVALLLVLAAACGGGGGGGGGDVAPEAAVAHRRLQVGGMDRTYRLYTPPDSEDAGPVPLVLALHGSGNSAESLVDSSELDQAADAGGFIVAYPEALGRIWNGGFCCTNGRGDPSADVRFLDQVITDVTAVRRIDEGRIYAVGFSGGGMMAYRLACDLAGRFAGVGAIAASMVLDDCRPARPVSVIAVHGTADEVVPYQGGRIQGGATKPAPPPLAVAERWAELDACADARTSDVRDTVATVTWSQCGGGTEVRLVTVEGGGHNWYLPVYGPPNGALDATATITEFLGLRRR